MRRVVSGVFCLLVWAGSAGGFGQRSAVARSVAEQYLFAAANADRAQVGLPALRWDVGLSEAALGHARRMAAQRSISHQYAGEPELASRAQAAGARFSVVTENVGEAPSAPEMHSAWMKSVHHRENLLDPTVDAVAISVVQRSGQLYAVEDFARTVPALTFEVQEDAVLNALADGSAGVNLLPRSEDARATCRLASGYAGVRQPWFVMRYTTGDLSLVPMELRQKMSSGKFRQAAVGACSSGSGSLFASYAIAVLLYP